MRDDLIDGRVGGGDRFGLAEADGGGGGVAALQRVATPTRVAGHHPFAVVRIATLNAPYTLSVLAQMAFGEYEEDDMMRG